MSHPRRDHDSGQVPGSAHGASGSWRVVIAEDEALPAALLKRTLLRLGHRVVGSAQNGLEAIALTRQLQPDVVVMDLRMPVADGWTALTELARQDLAPVVVVSAVDDRDSPARAVMAGASAFLTKPVREDDLARTLELAIARFANLEELRRRQAEADELRRELEAVNRALRTTQAHLAIAARRAANAGLAHGLTHEINNALTPIIGNAQILAMLHAQSPETVERTRQIIEHARRIAGWTASFRQLAGVGEPDEIEFSFNGVARDVFEFFAERFQRLGIAVQLELDAELPAVRGNPDRLQQVLMLLVQNATEAMPQGGELYFQTGYDTVESSVRVTLTDTGSGVAPEHAVHLFEPGFTTKDEGTHALAGWGLYTTRQIVQAHGGSIEISSPLTAGAHGITVRLRLPIQNGVAA